MIDLIDQNAETQELEALNVISPQSGQQMKLAECTADICIFGGQAGGGKTYGLLLEALRGVDTPGYHGVIFRRERPHIVRPGGLWDTALELYHGLGGVPRISALDWGFPGGGRVLFAHMQLELDCMAWQGSQIPFIGWDELTHFTEKQFWYLVSRNRSTCGMKPYIRATCNPEPGSWVARFIGWWVGADGFPIPERDGVVRWMCRAGDDIVWADTVEELMLKKPKEVPTEEWMPRSVTFIRSTLADNPALTKADPGYRAALASLPLYERQLLLYGNWKATPGKGMRFRREWFQIVDTLPELEEMKRYWDRAGTEPDARNPDPDHTAGVKGGKGPGQLLYVTDVEQFRVTAARVESKIAECAKLDRSHQGYCDLILEQDPAQAGKVEAYHLSVDLEQYCPRFVRPTGHRYTRAGPCSSAAENGRIKLLRAPWNDRFLTELTNFIDDRVVKEPPGYHDDMVTAFVGWYEEMMLSSGSGPRIY